MMNLTDRITPERRSAIQQEALSKATNGQSLTNYTAIYSGFLEKGIPENEIKPRVNVFTFNAWKALGRKVKKGEHGVKVCTYISGSKEIENTETGEKTQSGWKRPWMTTVFHVSQTEAVQ